jgi:hypothetical protein
LEAAPGKRPEVDRHWREVLAPRLAAGDVGREQALIGQDDLVSRVEALLFHHDPMSVNYEENYDEYRGEARNIVPRLVSAADELSVLKIVRDECTRMFGPVGRMESYRACASDIWQLLTEGLPTADDHSGFRLAYFVDGRSVAQIAWRNLRDSSEHSRVTTEKFKALALLDWVGAHPKMRLISFEVRP